MRPQVAEVITSTSNHRTFSPFFNIAFNSSAVIMVALPDLIRLLISSTVLFFDIGHPLVPISVYLIKIVCLLISS